MKIRHLPARAWKTLGIAKVRLKLQHAYYSRLDRRYNMEFSFSSACAYFSTRNDLYSYFHHYYHHRLPAVFVQHRRYVEREHKGFGEEAFHAMWWLLLEEFKPRRMLEIGVYRGQVISLWALICKHTGRSCAIHGISPFTSLGDSVSVYPEGVDYLADTLETFDHWQLDHPVLVKAMSEQDEAVNHVRSSPWDLIYVDGGHDFETVLNDYRLSFENLQSGGILVLDDASLNSDFTPPPLSSAGHPGPSRVASEYAAKEMRLIGAIGHANVFRKL